MNKRSRGSWVYLFAVLVVMYLPIFIMVLYSFNPSRISAVWEGFSFTWYAALLRDKALLHALGNSLLLAGISSLAAGIIGTMGALGLAKLEWRPKKLLEFFSGFPIMTPEIIMGIIFLAFFGVIGFPLGMGALVVAHTSFCIPYVYMQVKARIVGMDPSYMEAARDLGASGLRAFWDITLPAILPAVLSGMLLAFAMSLDEVVISILLNNSRSETLPVKIYTAKTNVPPQVNALCSILFLATTIIVIVFHKLNSGKQHTMNFAKERSI